MKVIYQFTIPSFNAGGNDRVVAETVEMINVIVKDDVKPFKLIKYIIHKNTHAHTHTHIYIYLCIYM